MVRHDPLHRERIPDPFLYRQDEPDPDWLPL